MRNREGGVEEKRFVSTPANEIERLLGKQVVRISRAIAVLIAGHFVALLIAPEKIGVIRVRVRLVEVAEILVESLLPRGSGRVGVAERPFAHAADGIAGLLKHLRQREIFRQQRQFAVRANASVTGVLAGEQRATRRMARRRTGVVLRHSQAFIRHLIQSRRANEPLAVGTEIAVA